MLGVPVEYFGLVFLTAVAGYMTGSGISARLAGRSDSEQVMLLGSALALFACVLILSAAYIWPRSVLALMLPMMLYATGLGLVLPHAMAIALRPFPHNVGTASALLGFVQMSLSAAASALSGVFLTDTPLPMLWAMLVISLLAMALALHSHRLYHRSNP